jgi:glycosyltransferase involved in cell wall biosynthesis
LSVGNDFLAEYGRQFNTKVIVNPTTIDTDNYHNRIKNQDSEEFVIGWTGTHSTLRYLADMVPVFKKLEQEYDFKLIVISDKDPKFDLNSFEFIKWQKETEIDDLLRFNLGLMPLTMDKWANGKCGFKALQYMSLGIPAIVSPVGVNTKIVDHNVNGYICDSEEEWEKTIRTILSGKQKIKAISKNSRQKIIDNYSVLSNKNNFIQLFQ